ncbi:MAG: AsmA-like C-terminal domain-containing protein [Sulfurimonadaceae bacterium]
MNDSTIIKAISKVHSIIIDLLIFISITLFTIYFTLHIGLKLDKFILPGLKIEQLYIKWDEKIVVDIDSVKITKSNTKSTFDFTSLDAKELLKQSRVLESFFSEVNIRQVQVNDINATFRYKEQMMGYIEVNGPTLKLLADIDMNDHLLLLSIKEFNETSTKTTMHGDILANAHDHRLYGDLFINVADAMPLKLLLLADSEKVQLWGQGSEVITKSIDPVVKIAHLGPLIEPWIADYLKGEALHLEYIKGTLIYDDPISLFDTLDVKAHYNNVEYTFAPGYAPAISPQVDLAFKDRILYIYPRKATFYGQPGGATWVKIDFETPANPLLTVDVDTTAKLTPELTTWLKGYKINLPFYQTEGKTKVKLAVWVTLGDIDVSAEGGFSTKKAVFNFSNTDINVQDVRVMLKNTHIDIKSLNASLLEGAIKADLSGQLDPVKESGKFNIVLNTLQFKNGENVFEMDTDHKKLRFSYTIDPKSDYLKIPKSYWRLNQKLITLNGLRAPFDFLSLRGTIPTTMLSSEDTLKAYVSGTFDIKNLETALVADLLKLNTPQLSLDQTTVPLEIRYKNGLFLNVKKRSHWELGNTKLVLFPSTVSYMGGLLYIKDANFTLADIFTSHLNGVYNTKNQTGRCILKTMHAEVGDTSLLKTQRDVKVVIDKKNDEHHIHVPDFDLTYIQNSTGWDLSIKDIRNIAERSPFMQEYNITTGALHLHSREHSDEIGLYGHVTYPYKILVKDNIPVKTINFNGTYQDETLDLFLNNNIKAHMKGNRLKINTEKVGVDIFAILDFLSDHPASDKTNTKSNFEVDIQAVQSYLYINKQRRALADKLLLQYKDDRLNAQLLHGKNGGAFLEYYDKKFFIYGDNLNDKFMDGLAEFSDFRGGKLAFYLTGKEEKIEGVVQITDTIVKDYKTLNNVFALLNTIPALVTFSVPHYTAKGLKVHEGYASFAIKDNMINIKGFHVNAHELAFNGKGSVNLTAMTHDVEMSLVTEAGTNLSKIPLLGYILVGKENDKATTTITMSGPLEDPVVKNTLAKDIVIAPFNIVKRALTFPVHYVEKAKKAIDEAEKK